MLEYSLPECYKIKCNSPGIFPGLVFLVDFLFEMLQQKSKKSPQKPQNVTVSIVAQYERTAKILSRITDSQKCCSARKTVALAGKCDSKIAQNSLPHAKFLKNQNFIQKFVDGPTGMFSE